MNRPKAITAQVLLAALVLLLRGSLSLATEPGVRVGDSFPDLSSFPLEGERPASLRGKIVIVDFWASWCAPCKETFPLLEQLHHRFGKKGLIILGVNEDKSRAAMTEFLQEHPVSFAVVRDARKKLAASVSVPGLPASYILDRDGKVLSIESGTRIAQDQKEFVKRIERLLDQKPNEK